MMGGGHPLELMHIEMKAMGFSPPMPPRSDVAGLEALMRLWRGAALDEIETREITVQRTFADFEDFWTTSTLSATVGQTITAMNPNDVEFLKVRMKERLTADVTGRIVCSARANAIKGTRPQ
jgi:hypothetical protein